MKIRSAGGPGARIVATLLLVWGGFIFQPSTTAGTAGSRAVDQINRSVTRPLPAAPAPKVAPSDQVWVPDRYVAGSDGLLLHVPGHWERRVNDQEVHTPPVVACPTGSGPCVLVPSGIRPEPEVRPGL
jgi:hypothetical protein